MRARHSSLRNAQRFIEDAEVLIQNSSFGHALALGIFADEEIAKGYICWFVENARARYSEIVRDVFRYHQVKHENQIWLHVIALFAEQVRLGEVEIKQVTQEGLMLNREQLERDLERLARLPISARLGKGDCLQAVGWGEQGEHSKTAFLTMNQGISI